ncbi:MAG: flagellar protein, partial [Pseudomonadota bacterium]
MSFQPIVPLPGYAGWSYLSGSIDAQIERMEQSPILKADFDYFRENIGSVASATDLISDFRLRRVALGAFGLSDDIANKAFIEKVLSEGTAD